MQRNYSVIHTTEPKLRIREILTCIYGVKSISRLRSWSHELAAQTHAASKHTI